MSFFSIQNIHILETGKGAHDANSKAQLESDEKNNLLAKIALKSVSTYIRILFFMNHACFSLPYYVASIVL